jgi:hypothetical protein
MKTNSFCMEENALLPPAVVLMANLSSLFHLSCIRFSCIQCIIHSIQLCPSLKLSPTRCLLDCRRQADITCAICVFNTQQEIISVILANCRSWGIEERAGVVAEEVDMQVVDVTRPLARPGHQAKTKSLVCVIYLYLDLRKR